MKKAMLSKLVTAICRHLVVAFVATMALSALLAARPATAKEKTANPDFTRGDKIPNGAKHDWNQMSANSRY